MLRGAIVCTCLAWVLVFGEPRVTTNCKSLDAFWKHRRRAKAETRDGECLLGRLRMIATFCGYISSIGLRIVFLKFPVSDLF